jgi:hypothetical protein
MIQLTEEERLALGLPLEGAVSQHSYDQVKYQINSELLKFAGATGWALDQDGNIESVTPAGITLESAEAIYLSYPKFNGRPYADDKSLNQAVSGLIQDAFVAHFSTKDSPYQATFDKVMTLVVSGQLQTEWAEWLEIRDGIIDGKNAYKASTTWGV